MLEDFERTFFPDARIVTLSIPLLSETLEELHVLAASYGRSPEEIARVALIEGMRLLGERANRGPLEASEDPQRDPLRLQAELAVMRYRAFTLLKTVQALELRLSGLEAELRTLRDANADLRARLRACEEERTDPGGRPR
ncbi:hypothetical protein [Thermoflexus hugenholtzii]|uniref:Uncharacterized protein n=1 Tax=Thermoflexus hugenholtzii JAD2 TaxID=877466 RepID=A0A212QQX2_9CHLR|nr:hypothetical protein [Thermoflexus hugenholtzii]SNB61922.1 hypothetical protein SAMN02746019_00027670 [Thermoflexus hugenholtzii JAD2]